jgi:hypothetical protein
MAKCKTVPSQRDERPHRPVTAERLHEYLAAALALHADIDHARPAVTTHMDRLAILAVDHDGLTWRVWVSRDPRDAA